MVAIHLSRSFIVSGLTRDRLDEHTDEVLRELLALQSDDLTDATVAVDLGTGVIDIEVVGVADSYDDAVGVADGAIRAAIHAAGGSTPEWRGVRTSAELIDA